MIYDALRDLVQFKKSKKRVKHPAKSVSICNFTKSNTIWVFHVCELQK